MTGVQTCALPICKYGNKMIDYRFFSDKNVFSFKQLAIRDAGNDWNNLHFRDALIHTSCLKTTNLDVQAYRPAVVYINGKYWGVYNIREKINEHYIAGNYGLNPDSIDLLEYDGQVMTGSNNDFIEMATFIKVNDMNDPASYETVENWLDFDNFIDYFVVETYSNNGDWLQNNVRYWREQKQGAKWRYILWDLDFGFTSGWWPFTASGLDTNLNKWWEAHSMIMNNLLQNTTFRNKFINRYADLINTLFTPANYTRILNSFMDSIDAEMPRQFETWGQGLIFPLWGNPGEGSYNNWMTDNYYQMLIFINNRPATARNQIEQRFGLNKQVSVTLDVYPPGAGTIKLNTIVPDSLPWAGIYFDGVPVTMTAIPNPGFQFSFWQSPIFIQNPDTNAMITLNVDTNDAFTAYFFGTPDTNRITFNEINYSSSSTLDAGDWVELYNYGTVDVDISGWLFKDSNDANVFTIPDNTILKKDEYLVLCRDTNKFIAAFPGVNNVLGSFSFGLSSNGENLRLFDESGNLYLSMAYAGSPPWPLSPNGMGPTLELIDPNNNLSNPYNWFEGCFGGSPGVSFSLCQTGVEEEYSTDDILLHNYPNPFEEHTTIRFTIQQDDLVKIRVIDIYGREVAELMERELKAGMHEVKFTANDLASGIYYYQLTTSTITATGVMQLIN